MENENETVEVTDPETFQNYIKDKWWKFMGYDTYKALKDKPPPYDMVEVVRCKDCKHSEVLRYYDGLEIRICRVLSGWTSTNEDDFCSRGERREDNA